ncbi:MAG: hypothetical protein OEV64_15455 [Desulfobulbaceae bacterium]|nr:hypothetical protein [Desulfobulbaceae bacterium]
MTTKNDGLFSAAGLPLLIGSVPLGSHRDALEWIMKATPEIPLWPQLPSNPLERMMPQFSEGIPCIREENPGEDAGRIFYDTSWAGFEEDMLAFYEDYLAAEENPGFMDESRFAVSRERAAGLYLLGEELPGFPDLHAVKGQVTGPFTMLTGIKDKEGRAGYYNETVCDMVVKGIRMKAAWQTRFLGRRCNRRVIMFIDEPALAGLGSSAFIGVDTDELRRQINEVAEGIQQAGGLAGIHVCANTDWSLLLGSKIDVLSFDAYGYFDRLAPLSEELDAYLGRGSILAWGGVPTSKVEDIAGESTESLVALWERQMKSLVKGDRDIGSLLKSCFITPSCGTGSLPEHSARKVLDLTRAVSLELRARYLTD